MTSQVVSACDAPNSRRKNGSAGITSVCMTAKEIPATVSSASVIQWRRSEASRRTRSASRVFRLTTLEAVDDADLKRTTWRSVVAFQRLFGLHAPDARLLEHPDFVASAVPASYSSLINAAAPIDGAAIAPASRPDRATSSPAHPEVGRVDRPRGHRGGARHSKHTASCSTRPRG